MGVFVRDELVGYGYCVGLGDSAAPFRSALYVAGFVHPRWRRRGVARAVHLARLAQLKQLGCEQAFAWVDEINGASRASLERCGFRKITPTPEQLTHRPTPRHELFSAVPRVSIPKC
jgi:RimJ/RimL family protein N-acetyltransferase